MYREGTNFPILFIQFKHGQSVREAVKQIKERFEQGAAYRYKLCS